MNWLGFFLNLKIFIRMCLVSFYSLSQEILYDTKHAMIKVLGKTLALSFKKSSNLSHLFALGLHSWMDTNLLFHLQSISFFQRIGYKWNWWRIGCKFLFLVIRRKTWFSYLTNFKHFKACNVLKWNLDFGSCFSIAMFWRI
jgi:hypothetical protein